jgi:hypothetical protein
LQRGKLSSYLKDGRQTPKHTQPNAGNRKENRFNDQEEDSEQQDLLDAKKFVTARMSQSGAPGRPQTDIEWGWTPKL